MRQRFILALITLAAAFMGLSGIAQPMVEAEYLGTYRWSLPGEDFGGFSGLEVTADGNSFVTMTDRGNIIAGDFLRDGVEIVGVVVTTPLRALKNTEGGPLARFEVDSEGLAIRDDGRIYISFEAIHRVWTYRDTESEAAWLPRHPDFKKMQNNSSLEALAIGPDGALYTMPERSGALDVPFPVYRYRNGEWTKPFAIPRRGPFLAVGADFGPDGKFYLLERALNSIFGFQTRVRRFSIEDNRIFDEEILIDTSSGRHDNMEGLAVWQDAAGDIRLTMISDDNFRMLQSTEFVEYRLQQ
jgi:hypothetical protein